MKIRRIEVQFGVPVELTSREMQDVNRIVNNAARRSQTPKLVHWAAGCGSKPLWREPEEPEWDDSIFFIECCARERFETELFHPFTDLRTKLLEEIDFLGRKDGGNIDEFEAKQAIARIIDSSQDGDKSL
jgi:hypothetical protein